MWTGAGNESSRLIVQATIRLAVSLTLGKRVE